MKKLLLIIFTFGSSSLALASLECKVECSSREGRCLELGIRGRASALHLN